jgi:hypothetical protein
MSRLQMARLRRPFAIQGAPPFLRGHLVDIIIHDALYGLHSSGHGTKRVPHLPFYEAYSPDLQILAKNRGLWAISPM